ncbi:ImmA/IrrE family metallo-endopeptidase [Nocardia fluminea]|uniref:ImmA/IrrE family metallo-endopeptidase n=1 Tax=Nocardia fluminea TaxID=134984 RepID=UPI0033ED1A2D
MTKSWACKRWEFPDIAGRIVNMDEELRAVGERGFSSQELARIADEIGADLHLLVTGAVAPRRVRIAARHTWDSNRGVRVNPGRAHDEKLLGQVVHAYNAAFPDGPPSSRPLPDDPADMRTTLGGSFVRQFGSVVESRLGVDVIRLPMLSTDYSLTIGSRAIIALATTPNWFRSNWSLAHELAHLALGHHNGDQLPGEAEELPADEFAANPLLPEEPVRQHDWQAMGEQGLARFLWETGVSTIAVKNRLAKLKIRYSTEVAVALKRSTPVAIRADAGAEQGTCERRRAIILWQQESSTRAQCRRSSLRRYNARSKTVMSRPSTSHGCRTCPSTRSTSLNRRQCGADSGVRASFRAPAVPSRSGGLARGEWQACPVNPTEICSAAITDRREAIQLKEFTCTTSRPRSPAGRSGSVSSNCCGASGFGPWPDEGLDHCALRCWGMTKPKDRPHTGMSFGTDDEVLFRRTVNSPCTASILTRPRAES